MTGDLGAGRPRLRTGVCWFDNEHGLVIRSTRGAFVVQPERRELAVRLLTSLDGERDLGALLGGYSPFDGLSAIALLSELDALHLIVGGSGAPVVAHPTPGGEDRRGPTSVTVAGAGLLADALRQRVPRAGDGPEPDDPTFSVLALDGPDLVSLDVENRAAHDAGRPWIPVFPFGDAVVVGPAITPGRTPCFRCFELRWLGISPSTALEREYLARLRDGQQAVRELDGPDRAATLAERIVPLLARHGGHSDGSSVVFLLATDGDSVHECKLTAHPHCDVCSSRDPRRRPGPVIDAELWFEAGSELCVASERIRDLVDPYLGIATALDGRYHDVDPPPGCPEMVLARYAVPQPELVTSEQNNWTHGARDNADAARTVALIEAIERYCGLFPALPDVVARFAELDGSALLPTELPLFSAAQYATPGFSYRPFEPDLLLGWTWGWNVTRSERVLVPSTAVWYGAEDLLVGETSNGVAAHTGRAPALHNGALELIERDAFMIHWLNRISPARFDLEHLRGDAAAMVARIEGSGHSVVLADITTDLGVPVVLALGIHEQGRRPALIVGAGASLDGPTALRRAVRELYAAAMGITADWELGPCLRPEEVVELEDHSRAYEHPDWLSRAAFLWAGTTVEEPPGEPAAVEAPDDLDRLVRRLAGSGHDVIGVDISTPEVARGGVRVVRAIVPGLQPLAFGTRIRLGGRRLYEAPVRMQARSHAHTEAELNHVPHCFP